MSRHIESRQCISFLPISDDSLEQQRYSFNDPYLAALLQVYKDYYPDVIVSDFRRAKSSVFRVFPHSVLLK
jgi:centromere protein I